MRILIFSQYFTPEVLAPPARLHPIASILAERGHDVEVICEVPNYPEGVVQEGYRGKATLTREMDGFTVRYVWVRTSPVKTTRSRLLLYGTFASSATIAGVLSRRPDLIFVSSPPLFTAMAAMAAAKRHRVPWVMDVRDPWPEAAVALGELTNPRLIRIAERIERRLYASAVAIVTVTEPFRADIAAKVEDPGKIMIVPNGTSRMWLEAGEQEVDRGELGLGGERFLWTYAGNVGIAQGLDAAVDAAGLLGNEFELLVIGAGPALDDLRQRAEAARSGKVSFRGMMQPAEAARHLRASDALLVPLGSQPALAKFVPSKLFDYCAVGRPVIVAALGEAPRLAGEAGAALTVPPGDPQALADAVRRLRDEPQLAQQLASSGREFAGGYLRERQVERLEELLSSLAG